MNDIEGFEGGGGKSDTVEWTDVDLEDDGAAIAEPIDASRRIKAGRE